MFPKVVDLAMRCAQAAIMLSVGLVAIRYELTQNLFLVGTWAVTAAIAFTWAAAWIADRVDYGFNSPKRRTEGDEFE
jgi:hypothetical protein